MNLKDQKDKPMWMGTIDVIKEIGQPSRIYGVSTDSIEELKRIVYDKKENETTVLEEILKEREDRIREGFLHTFQVYKFVKEGNIVMDYGFGLNIEEIDNLFKL